MQPLIDRDRKFATDVVGRGEFARLVTGRDPRVLLISCSDSRVTPTLITEARPGQLFELRNVGNIVPTYRNDPQGAVSGTVEFAMLALGVTDVVVCGHSRCVAVKCILRQEQLVFMPVARRWLGNAGDWDMLSATNAEKDLDAAVQRHVLAQVRHLRTHPSVAEGIAAGTVRLHAWFYRATSDEIFVNEAGTPHFFPL